MQSTARENVNIPAYGNVEHQGTAIVSEISIKWARARKAVKLQVWAGDGVFCTSAAALAWRDSASLEPWMLTPAGGIAAAGIAPERKAKHLRFSRPFSTTQEAVT